MTKLLHLDWKIGENSDGIFVKKTQNIGSDFNKQSDIIRENNGKTSEGYLMASIPVIVVEKWMREGFNIFDPDITARSIRRRLKREGLDAFLTSSKEF